ncbi:Disks large -like protein 1 [Trichinella sp. T9]|nr:Disks large -like protein 1 [Trichinella sp. T9]
MHVTYTGCNVAVHCLYNQPVGLGSNQTRSIAVVTTMPVKKQEAHRALELLEEYHKSLIRADDRQLREAIERVITIFKCRLFQALLEIQEFYEETLLNEHKSLLQKTVETNLVADRWEGNPPIVGPNASNKTTDSYASFVDAYKKSTSPTVATSTISSFPASLRGGPQRDLDSPGPFYTSAPSGQPKLFNNISQPVRDSWQDDSLAADSRYTNGSHDDNWEYEEIILEKGTIAGLGFSISGGRDNPHVADDPSIYVTKIIPGGAAAYDGRLRKDDIILRVNQIDTTDVYHHVAVDALKQAGNIVKLFVRRRVRDDDATATTAADCAVGAGVERRIELLKGNKGLGFSIAGGVGNEHVPNDAGIYVTKIIDGGAAQVDGRLAVGDKLLAVGNCSLDNVTHETAVAALKATADRVVLTVLKPISSGSAIPFADGNEPGLGSNPGLFDHSATTPTTIGGTATALRLSRQQEMRRAMGAGAEDALSASASSSSYTPYALPEPAATVAERRHSVGAVFGEPNADAGGVGLPGRSPRRVTLNKGGAGGGLGFNIVGGEDGEGIYISYILPGGVADVSGLLHKGDQLLEVNGVDLRNATHEEAAAALKSGGQKIYILAAYRPEEYYRFEAKIEQLRNVMIDQNSPQPRRELYVRALFDYDPSKDSGLPSRGLAFNYGDILHVTNACDDDWWQARKRLKDGTEDGYGIIPSKRRVEKRERSRRKQVNFGSSRQSSMSEKHSGARKQLSLSRKFPFMKSKERLHEELENERLEDYILSYQPVEQHYLNYVRPVIILGALKDRINDDLTAEYPDNFACCVPHTSRPRREHEVDGRDYYFVSREVMEHDIHNHLFIEAGQYNGNLYGTSIGSVRDVSEQNKHCILDVSGNAIKRLQLAGLYPIVIFIKPYGPGQLMEWNRRITEDDAVRVYQRCLQIEQEFGESFTAVVQGDVPEEIYERVKEVIRDQSGPVVWVPSQEGL